MNTKLNFGKLTSEELVNVLADHVERFNCSVYVDGRLMLFTDFPVSGNRRYGVHVGKVRKVAPMDWRIKSLESAAPDYLKPLVGQSFAGQNLLKSAVRKALVGLCFSRPIHCSSSRRRE